MQPGSTVVTDEEVPKTVLIVEEDDAQREALANELLADGYRVVALEDGLELFEYLELVLTGARVPRPAMIVSDVSLAGYDGVTLCRIFSHAEAGVPFILLAPSDDPDSWEDAEAAGASHVLDKPVDLRSFHKVVACYLGD